MPRPPCHCTGRTDIRCDATHCDIAHPTGAPHNVDQCVVCWQWLHSDPHNRVWGGSGAPQPLASRPRPVPRSSLPCVHLGEPTGETRPCKTCTVTENVPLRHCTKHGTCSTDKLLPGVQCCTICPDREPDTYRLVAPWGTRDVPNRWEGRSRRRPWQYRVTASIPHLDTLEPLAVVVETLRAQTERPYLMVIDTGSPPEVCDELERMRADDLEIHYIRGHAYIQSSAPVSTAMDLAFALCRSEFHYCTHVDVFLKRPDYVAWLLTQCNASCPAVGYEMSERSWATDLWRGMVSHTASMFHMPTIRRLGCHWSMEHGYDLAGWTGKNANGWPDTEVCFNLMLRAHGIAPKLLGPETNYKRYEDANLIHTRSYPGRKIYDVNPELLPEVEAHLRRDMEATRARVRGWGALDGGPRGGG